VRSTALRLQPGDDAAANACEPIKRDTTQPGFDHCGFYRGKPTCTNDGTGFQTTQGEIRIAGLNNLIELWYGLVYAGSHQGE
jgi:hypothetical protein